jgi:hypothetical protein
MLESEHMKSKPAVHGGDTSQETFSGASASGFKGTGVSSGDSNKCKCTGSQQMSGTSKTSGGEATAAASCSYGNNNCNCPSSCACGGMQSTTLKSGQQFQSSGQQQPQAFSGTKKFNEQQQQQQPQSSSQKVHTYASGPEQHQSTTHARK